MTDHHQNVSELCNAIGISGQATADDVRRLRNAAMKDGRVDRQEVEAALAADGSITERSQEWVFWLREITVDHLFGVGETKKDLSERDADWLLGAVAPLATNDSRARLEVLVRVVETACSMPDAFYTAVLNALAAAVLANQTDDGPIICAADAGQLRRVLYASAGDGQFAISRAEAEFLFDLNDQTSERLNAPEWTQLFVQAVSNHLMASFGHAPLNRQAAFSQPVETTDDAGFWSKVLKGLSDTLRSPSQQIKDHYADANVSFAENAADAQRVTKGEAQWVFERIARNHDTDANEQALLKSSQLDDAA